MWNKEMRTHNWKVNVTNDEPMLVTLADCMDVCCVLSFVFEIIYVVTLNFKVGAHRMRWQFPRC